MSSSPNASISNNPSGPFCIDGTEEALSATPAGGTWSGNGITDPNTGTWSPSTAGVGTHEITYSVGGNGQCPAVANKTLEVNDLPSIVVTGNPLSGCAPLEVKFFNATANSNSATWNFGDGTPELSGTQYKDSALHTFESGNHTITVSVIDDNGCSNTETYTDFVNVDQTPTSLFSFIELGENTGTFQFTNESQFGNDYFWDFGDGNTSEEEDLYIHSRRTATSM